MSVEFIDTVLQGLFPFIRNSTGKDQTQKIKEKEQFDSCNQSRNLEEEEEEETTHLALTIYRHSGLIGDQLILEDESLSLSLPTRTMHAWRHTMMPTQKSRLEASN